MSRHVVSFEHEGEGPATHEYILELKENGVIMYSLLGESYNQITFESVADTLRQSNQYTIFKDPYDRRAKALYRDGIPEHETVERNGHIWELTEYDTGCYHWIRELNEDEYDWDPEEDNVSIVGFDKPCRTVDIRLENGGFSIVGNETAGPNYHRPGYTEPISSEYSENAETTEEALEKALNMIEQLS